MLTEKEGRSRSTASTSKKMQGEVSEVMSTMPEDNVQVAIPMLPAMPTKLVESHNSTGQDREDAVSFAESSVSKKSVPSEVSIESSKDIFSISLPFFIYN